MQQLLIVVFIQSLFFAAVWNSNSTLNIAVKLWFVFMTAWTGIQYVNAY